MASTTKSWLHVAALLGLITLLGLAACATEHPEDAPLVVAPIVIKGDNAAADGEPVDSMDLAEAEAALASAQAAWQDGDALAALAIANHALRKQPPSAVAFELRKIREQARSSVVAAKVLRIHVLPDKDAVVTGDTVTVSVVLQNVSTATLRIPKNEDGSSDARAVLWFDRKDYDTQGNVRSLQKHQHVPLTEDLVIGPGGEASLVTRLPAEITTFKHVGFSVLRIGGTFHPVALRVGESEFFDAIPLEPAAVRVFLENYEPLAADPLASLEKAIEKRSPPHILTCTELLPPKDRPAARRLLTRGIEEDPPLQFVLEASLKRLDALASGGSPLRE